MKYRQLRVRATGQWLDVLFIAAGPEFSVPAASHQADIARALGLSPDALEVVDADSDLRVGPLQAIPSPPAPRPDPDLAAFDAALLEEKLNIIRRRLFKP